MSFFVYSAIVEKAIAISKKFEASSRAREKTMRASEQLPLTSQADAAFLLKFVQMGLEIKEDKGQLLRTLNIIREATLKEKKKDQVQAMIVELEE